MKKTKIVALVGLVITLGLVTFYYVHRLKIQPQNYAADLIAQSGSIKEISMTAQKFSFSPSTITATRGQQVRLSITSTDVMHGFSLPDFGVPNVQLNPGQTTVVNFYADKIGTFSFFCSVVCGDGHPNMRGTIQITDTTTTTQSTTTDPVTYCTNNGGRWLTSNNTCEFKNSQGCWPSTEAWCSYTNNCKPKTEQCTSTTTTTDSHGCNTSTQFWCISQNVCMNNGNYCPTSTSTPPPTDSHGCNTSTQFWCISQNVCMNNGNYCPTSTSTPPPTDSHGCNTSTQFWCISQNVCMNNGNYCPTSTTTSTTDSHGCTSTQFWCISQNVCMNNGNYCPTSTSGGTTGGTSGTDSHGCFTANQFWCVAQNACLNNGSPCSNNTINVNNTGTSGSTSTTSGETANTSVVTGIGSGTTGISPNTTSNNDGFKPGVTSGSSDFTSGSTGIGSGTTGVGSGLTDASSGTTAINPVSTPPVSSATQAEIKNLTSQINQLQLQIQRDQADLQRRSVGGRFCRTSTCLSLQRQINQRIGQLNALQNRLKTLSPSSANQINLPQLPGNTEGNVPPPPGGPQNQFGPASGPQTPGTPQNFGPTLPTPPTTGAKNTPAGPVLPPPPSEEQRKVVQVQQQQKNEIIFNSLDQLLNRFSPPPTNNKPGAPAQPFSPSAQVTQTENIIKTQLTDQCKDTTSSACQILNKISTATPVSTSKEQQTLKNQQQAEAKLLENDPSKYWENLAKNQAKEQTAPAGQKLDQAGTSFLSGFLGTQAYLAQINNPQEKQAKGSGDTGQSAVDNAIEQATKKIADLTNILEQRKKELDSLQEKLGEAQEKIVEQTAELAQKVENTLAEHQAEVDQIKEQPKVNDIPTKYENIVEPETKELLEHQDAKENQDIIFTISQDQVKTKAGLFQNLCPEAKMEDTGFVHGPCAVGNILAAIELLGGGTNSEVHVEADKPIVMGLDKSTTQIGTLFVQRDLGLRGKSVKVAILDSGINENHPALKGKVVKSIDFTGEGTDDLNGHGTNVASIVASQDKLYLGNAPDAELLNVKVMNKDGAGKMSYAIQGVNWAVDNGAQVINVSLGAPIETCDGKDSLSQAVEEAIAKGVIVIAAAGNFGPDAKTVASPGCAVNAITVGAVDDSGVVATFSSRGPTASGEQKPDILAPGVGIAGAWIPEGYASLSGTSQAAPHVAAVAALLLEADPKLTPAQMKQVLMATADPVKTTGSNMQNQGIVNAYTAASQYVQIKQTVKETVGEDAVKESEAEKAARQVAEADQEVVIVEKEASTFTEAREQLRTCMIEAAGNQEAKDACSKTFLKAQVKIQKARLDKSEQKTLQELATKALDLNKLAEKYSGQTATDLKTMASVLYYSIFPTDISAGLIKEVDRVFEQIDNGQNIDEIIKALKKHYFDSRDQADLAKFNRGLLPFKDVGDRQWYFVYVNEIKDKKIITGYKDAAGNDLGQFGPGNTLTVAEALKIVLEASGQGKSSSDQQPKNTLAVNHWSKAYYLKAEELNLSIAANSNDNPNRPITREEVVTLIVEAFKIPNIPVFTAIFSDVPKDQASAKAIYTAFTTGIVAGDANASTFRPKALVNRAEMAKMVVETLDVKK